jgi:hypothetical protein
MTLMFFGILAAASAYYLANPKASVEKANTFLVGIGVLPKPPEVVSQPPTGHVDSASEAVQKVDVYVSSAPSGAPINIDGEPTGEVTPATIKLEKGRKVLLSLKLAGYLPMPYEERFRVDEPRSIDVRFKADVKGFLNIIVVGEGQIYINDVPIESKSPARMIPVAANEDLHVVSYDPKTRARAEEVVQVAPGASRTVTLEPKASIGMPVPQPPKPRQTK